MPRNFRGKDRIALYLAADGKSDLSGEPLGEDFHADHVVPWSRGGETDVVNGQALTPKENWMKSDRQVIPRQWQTEFLRRWASTSGDYLLSALPGGGKTIAALLAAVQFIKENPRGKIIIIVPSTNLRDQWQTEAANAFGIELQSKEFHFTLKGDFHGAVSTYQTVANQAAIFRAMVSKQPTLVILDEVHHAGDDQTWGSAIRSAFEPARRRLCLSGTPFRTDGTPIPFLNYDADGYCVPDMTYDYPTAIKDGVVRMISFDRNAGNVEYRVNGELVLGTIEQGITEEEASKHLRKLISSEGDFALSILAKANERLNELRQNKPEAGGLVLCADAGHAKGIASILHRITDKVPDIVLSDDEKANSSVDEYRRSNRPWIVAVRQVSEGVDIKRLMVLCYLTNTVTELFFRQAIGRIVRNEGTDFDNEAYCFIPDDPRLVAMAQRIEDSQLVALKELDEEESEKEAAEREACEPPDVEIIGTSFAEHRGIIVAGNIYETNEAEIIRTVSKSAAISHEKAAIAIKVLRGLGIHTELNSVPEQTRRVESVPVEKQANDLRSRLMAKVNRLSKITNRPHRDINAEYRRIVSIPPKQMTLQQLKEKLQWLDSKTRAASR